LHSQRQKRLFILDHNL